MPKPKTLTCQTCRSRELHEPLTPDEKKWLEGQLGNRIGDDFYKCVNGLPDGRICLNLRRHSVEKHFALTKRLPDKKE
ncbi:hypothetical protein F9278_14385 [Streptomyces phaeolivaceus]|uniref:Uncharacterized protein n=1 Tax=Streptomyces phaeolivaceus TaxID=2653200 RepID=A0A5P8K1T1_9ACTN|nr:hypothetical protein [Streptomyces phaeolivaceus]QFQ97203.1 hypothetical protein F9278_14385 [Streptomyces phaeolivaceus]